MLHEYGGFDVRFWLLAPVVASLVVAACDDGGFEPLSPEDLASHLDGEALMSFDVSSGLFNLPVPSGVMEKVDAERTALLIAGSILKRIIIGSTSDDASVCGTYYSHSAYEDPPGLQRDDGQFGDFWMVNLCVGGDVRSVVTIYARSPAAERIPQIMRYADAANLDGLEPLPSAEEAASLLIRFLDDDVRIVGIPRMINGWLFRGIPATQAKWEFQVVEPGKGSSKYYVGRFLGNGDRSRATNDFVVMHAVGEFRRGVLQGRRRIGPDQFELVDRQ